MKIERMEQVALLHLNEGKANAIGPPFLEALNRTLDDLGDARALVITGHESTFSAGFDIPFLLGFSEPDLRAFLEYFTDTMLRVFSLDVPLVAAVNGHAIAGGCVLALQADVRLAVEDGAKIGLSEAQLAIGLPVVVLETARFHVPARSLVSIALEGRIFSPREALDVGLVDALVPKADLMARAVERARQLTVSSRETFAEIKRTMRRPTIEAVARARPGDAARWTATWFSEEGQARLKAAATRIGGRR